MSFPAYKNSFSEEVADQPKTQFSILSTDDYLLNNTAEFVTKMTINDGSFKLKNVIATKEEDGDRKYTISNDATLEYFCDYTKASLRTKFKPNGLQFQLDFPKYSAFRGSVNPYLRIDSTNNLTKVLPSLGWIFILNDLKIHVSIKLFI
jgi:hypothetical protein